jgi:HD-GYP domain-containing protein (c-di-GMP phosphodiesterase class II)
MYSLAIARRLNLTDEERENLRLAAILHDVGKIGIEDTILKKISGLDENEYEIIKQHPKTGEEILGHITMLKDVIPGMKYHHERVDGMGYPDGLSKDEIPLIAKIIAVADTFDAITTDRAYRKAVTDDEALRELSAHAGTQFDEEVVRAFTDAYTAGEIR